MLHVYGCAMTMAETLPTDHAGWPILEDFRTNRLDKREAGARGYSRAFLKAGALVGARVHDSASPRPEGFRCDDTLLTFMTLEMRYGPSGAQDDMGLTVSQLDETSGDWRQSYERSFSIAGIYADKPVAAQQSAMICPSP